MPPFQTEPSGDSGRASIDDDDAALLRDLLAFLDEPSSPSPSACSSDGGVSYQTPTAKPAARKRLIKRTLDSLRVETQQLTAQLDRLRRSHGEAESETDSVASTKELALCERFKRRKAEQERQQLRDALDAHALFLHGLQLSVLSASPSFSTGLNLCLHLHDYTKLPRDRATRWNELAAVGAEPRLRRAMDIVDRETQKLTQDEIEGVQLTPRIQIHASSDRDGFTVTTASVYAVETTDIGAVLRAACVALVSSISKCRSYECSVAKRVAVDLEASSVVPNMFYRVLGVRQQSRCEANDALLLESRAVTLYKQTEDEAIVLWDYVDEDELQPPDGATDIDRQAVGAWLIRREICGDGVERCVCRCMSTRRYRYCSRPSSNVAALDRYERASAPRDHELLVRDVLLDAIAAEENAYVTSGHRQ